MRQRLYTQTFVYCHAFLDVKTLLKISFQKFQIWWDSNSPDFMPSHIKRMDKMLKISVISNTPSSQLFVGTSFIAQNFILKSSKFYCLARNCPDKFKCSLVTMATAFKKWTISLENDVWHLWDFNTIHHRNKLIRIFSPLSGCLK